MTKSESLPGTSSSSQSAAKPLKKEKSVGDELDDLIPNDKDNDIGGDGGGQPNTTLWIAAVAIFLRLFSAHYFSDFFQQLPLFSSPWSSLKRLREGVFLLQSGQPVYSGDLVHALPMFIHALRPTLEQPPWFMAIEWMLLDLLAAYFLSAFVLEYIRARCASLPDSDVQFAKSQWLSSLAFAGYLLNPMSIGCWTVTSLAAIVNTLIAASLYFSVTASLPPSLLCLSLAVQLNPSYLVMFAPICLQFKERRFLVLISSAFCTVLLFAMNLFGESNPSDLLRSTLGFFLSVPDLTPNCGLFWYFFSQVFEHYRLLFLCVFQLNLFVYVVPFSALIRNNPALLASILLISVSLFSPYPSYAESALYLPTLAAFFDIQKYLRWRLVVGCTFLSTFVLSPIMWNMWVFSGSGNANFFFAIVLVFNLAQILLSADLISSYLREQLISKYGGDEEIEKRFEGVRLISVSPL